MINKQGLTNF